MSNFNIKDSLRKRALFIPASIRSHIIPTLYLADLLSEEYDIHYLVTNQVLANIVSENGYSPILDDHFRIGVGMEHSFLQSKKQKATFWQVLFSIYTNELYWHRKRALDETITHLQPDIVFIDIFNTGDFLALYSYYSQTRLVFCNPMLSTYSIDRLSIISESKWHQYIVPLVKNSFFSLNRLLRSPRAELLSIAMRYQWKKLQQIVGLSAEHEVIETLFTRLFANVPEILLAPLEFELSPDVQHPNQHYLGLCVRDGRNDTELDPDFAQQWPAISARKQRGDRIIYCSFGTFYIGPDRILLNFIEKLLTVVSQLANVQLICSVNRLVIETIQAWHKPPNHVHFFSRVPQLQVLQQADVFITHGGLGSIKESIYYGVPMLVYPLDPHYDQPSNALKVEHHGLGLRGVFHNERETDLEAKLQQLLNDRSFTVKIQHFRREMEAVYTRQFIMHMLTNS